MNKDRNRLHRNIGMASKKDADASGPTKEDGPASSKQKSIFSNRERVPPARASIRVLLDIDQGSNTDLPALTSADLNRFNRLLVPQIQELRRLEQLLQELSA
ncbi:unnamed protein product, partial [Heterosigma akashiwo]